MDLKIKRNETQTKRETYSQDPHENEGAGGGKKQLVKEQNFKRKR